MKTILLSLLILFSMPSCSSVGGAGVEAIEGLTPERYDQVVRYTKIGVSFGLGQLLDRNIIKAEDRWILETVGQTLSDVAEGPASESVGNLLTDAIGRIPAMQEYAQAGYIMAVLAIAENFVLDRGGFGVVEQADGTWALSDRTKGILLALAEGVEEALAAGNTPEESGGAQPLRTLIPITPEGNAREAFQRAQFQVYGPSLVPTNG